MESIGDFSPTDIIFGTHTLQNFPEDLYNTILSKKKMQDVIDIDGEVYEGLPIKRTSNIKASVTIMYGCNNFCTYCIVPYVRGRERSRHPKDILEEVEQLAKENGIDYNGINSFATLLRTINKIEGIERIRFVSPHPKDFTDDVIDAIAECEKVCKLVHLPLQSGSTNVLKLMNRKYTKEQYLELVKRIKTRIPNIKFSTDIIVGFAGETEEDFEDTLDVVRKVGFEQVFMFIYSIRKGTPGENMENQIPDEIKHERFNRLKKLVEDEIAIQNKEYINTVQKVLVEGPSKNNKDMLTGRTENNKVVIFEEKKDFINKMLNIKLIEDHMWYFKGEII